MTALLQTKAWKRLGGWMVQLDGSANGRPFLDGLSRGSTWHTEAGLAPRLKAMLLQEWKRFCFADVIGLARALHAGLSVTLISGEDSPLVDRFAATPGLTDITKGCRDKAVALSASAERQNYALAEICFMGDDINDLPAMQPASFSAAPLTPNPEPRPKR